MSAAGTVDPCKRRTRTTAKGWTHFCHIASDDAVTDAAAVTVARIVASGFAAEHFQKNFLDDHKLSEFSKFD